MNHSPLLLMIRLSLVSVFTATVITDAEGQWNMQNSTTARNLHSVSFVDSLNGWAAGDSGIVLHTNDGGSHWLRQQSTVTVPLLSISFCDTQNGWAVGSSGTILKTSNGGVTWVRVSKDTAVTVRHFKVQALTPLAAVVLRDNYETDYYTNHLIWKTLDGGASWSNISPRKNYYRALNDMHFITPSTGWACGFGGWDLDALQIHRTTDGGATWATSPFGAPTLWSARKIFFKDENEGWAFADSLYYSTNGGQSWSGVSAPDFGSPNDFVMFGSSGYLTGIGIGVKKTTNGGVNWMEQPSAASKFFEGISFVTPDIGWIVGWAGRIMHTTNGGNASGSSVFYPLHVGNRWQFTAQPSGGISLSTPKQVMKDSTMENGKTYAAILYDQSSAVEYQRQQGDSIFIYDMYRQQESLLYRFNAHEKDTVSTRILGHDTTDVILIDSTISPIWGKRLRTYSFGIHTRHYIDDEHTITIVDSIGVIRISDAFGYVNTIQGAVIDGKRYGTIADVHSAQVMPSELVLSQNFPNPFNPSTTISFSLPSRSFISLKVFDVMGREVATIASEEMSPGKYSRQWNASGISSGVYFYRLQVGSFTETKQLLLIR